MAINVSILKESNTNEPRVAATPETIKKLTALGCSVKMQKGAGEKAGFSDDAYKGAGAKLETSLQDTLKAAQIILHVSAPDKSALKNYPSGAILIGLHAPFNNDDYLKALADHKLIAFSMELVPRITRAQSMDVLSSQSNLAGYKSVLDACEHYGRALPMMMTAAGTIPPAKVFVMGAGVAGLQAIATAKRLGAIVTATDVRPAAKEQVESLGGSFVAVEDDEFKEAETAGGYAKEMSKDYQAKQAKLVEEHIAKQDIVITTALIPGRPAPKLITEAMVKSMKTGSVIVDLAVENGGNCALSKAGEIIEKDGVKIIGHKNVPGRLAADASSLYARNLLNLINTLVDKESGKLSVNWEDDIVKGIALTKDGRIIHPHFKGSVQAEKKAAKTKQPVRKASTPKKPQTQSKTAAKKADTAKKVAPQSAEKSASKPKTKTASKKAPAKKQG
ncbi:MAG: Re/Si-specific NAD(P)(+) transhydrogenase subunit alpha [Alphaproteobacteria bacterium]